MISSEIKEQVLQWIADGCEWNQGNMLYSQFGKNQNFLRNIKGKPNSESGRLIAGLCKSVGLDYQLLKSQGLIPEVKISVIRKQENEVKGLKVILKVEGSSKQAEAMPETIDTKNIEQYPAAIRRVIAEYAEMFQERSKTHRIMTEMPEGNSQTLKTKRGELFDIVKGLGIRLEFLFDIRTVYDQTGFVPTDDEIWPEPKEKVKTVLPDSPEELRKMKKNQQSANTKDQSMLDYQSEKKAAAKNTMPTGPKRMKLENRIKARLKLIEEIDYKLVKVN